MFERNLQFWDAFSSGGNVRVASVIVLVLTIASLIGATIAIIIDKGRGWSWGRTFWGIILLLIIVAFTLWANIVTDAVIAKQTHYKVIDQIEEKYNLEVDYIISMESNGQDEKVPLIEITQLSGKVQMDRIENGDGNWFEPKFKFSLKQGEEVNLFPLEEPDSEALNPDTYLKE